MGSEGLVGDSVAGSVKHLVVAQRGRVAERGFDVWCELGNGHRWRHNDLEGPLSWEQAMVTVRWIEAAVVRDAALLPVVVNVRLAGGS